MKRVATGLVLAGLLAGCAGKHDTPEGASFAGTSSKAPEQYAACLLPKWQAFRPQAEQSATDTGVKLVAAANFTQGYLTANIDRDAAGSRVVLYTPTEWQESTAWRDMAKACL